MSSLGLRSMNTILKIRRRNLHVLIHCNIGALDIQATS